jgi:hypothetical protein
MGAVPYPCKRAGKEIAPYLYGLEDIVFKFRAYAYELTAIRLSHALNLHQ